MSGSNRCLFQKSEANEIIWDAGADLESRDVHVIQRGFLCLDVRAARIWEHNKDRRQLAKISCRSLDSALQGNQNWVFSSQSPGTHQPLQARSGTICPLLLRNMELESSTTSRNRVFGHTDMRASLRFFALGPK